jgi:glycosyltransferase involved in cell wall biosynthesis
MRVLVVSHPCVTPLNQDFFGRLGERGGFDIDLVLPDRWHNEYGTQVASRSPGYGGGLYPLPVLGRGHIPLHVYRAQAGRILRERRPDLVYVHHEPYALATIQWAIAIRDRVPFGFYAAQNLLKTYPRPIRLGERFVHRHASFALPVAGEVEHVLRQRGYRGASEVMPLAIDPGMFGAIADDEASPPVIRYFGRLSEEKGVDTLLEACAKIRDLDYRCLIAGDGPARAQLHDLARSLDLDGRVEWLGYVDHAEVGRLYERMNVVVVPSKTTSFWKEQFGRVVLEALAAGVPVVTSDSGELPRLVGRTSGGWTFPEGDAGALARVLRGVVPDPELRRRTGAIGARCVHEHFELDAVVDRFAAVLREHASDRRTAAGNGRISRAEPSRTVS